MIKEMLFLEGKHGEVLRRQLQAFLDAVASLIKKAIQNKELQQKTHCHDGALAYWSFYFTGLTMGLAESSFDISKQLAFVERLIDNYFHKTGS
jgi:hypothetical protein